MDNLKKDKKSGFEQMAVSKYNAKEIRAVKEINNEKVSNITNKAIELGLPIVKQKELDRK